MKKFPVAYPRILHLSDPDSFEILKPDAETAVLSGFCKVAGRLTAVFAQEPTKFAGAMGKKETEQICHLMDRALEKNCPVIGLNHSSGAKIQEGVASLAGYAEIFKRNVQLSGRVPQISLILGTSCGGAVYSPALTDFILMAENRGEMFITGPNVIRQVTGEAVTRESLGSAEIHARKSGLAHLTAKDEMLLIQLVKKLLSYLPANCNELPAQTETSDSPDRKNPELELLAKEERRKSYEARTVIEAIADRGTFLEIAPQFAENIRIGFARMDGIAVGFVANNPADLAGALDVDASIKAARFVRFCNAFNLPIFTLVDVPGYLPGMEQEHAGIIRHGAKLLYAYAEAEVPKITLILRKSYGGAFCVMGSKACGANAVFAWPCAEIAVMGPEGAVEILYKNELTEAKESQKQKQEKIESYLKDCANPLIAFKEKSIDKIIAPQESRREMLGALKKSLQNFFPRFKHKNIPL